MSTSAAFGTALFGEAVFGISLRRHTPYTSLSAFETACEAVDDTKFLAAVTYREHGTKLSKISLMRRG
jgi:hypothetical protein